MLGLSVDWDGATQTVLLDKPSNGTIPVVTATPDTPAKTGTKEIKTYIEPGIKVKYNGEIQSMKDAAGNTIYPVLHNGTTYLPIRAVSNMLDVTVDWDGATQTVLLGKSTVSDTTAAESNTVTKTHIITFNNPTTKSIRMLMEMQGLSESIIDAAVAEFEVHGSNAENGTFIYTFEVEINKADTFKTTEGAITLGDKHVGCGYAEVDYSMANKGYVQVKLTAQTSQDVYCSIDWANLTARTPQFKLKLDQWVKIPLPGGSDYYQLTVNPIMPFNVAFNATVENPDAFALLPNPSVDFENASKAVAKAAELTKNCKTDTEKITAIFNWVATNIKYDYDADTGASQHRSLDDILDSKTGICVNYAELMAGMLRSQGVPCKVISGKVYSNGKWANHAWVAISPDTKGLDIQRLGAGHELDGWIRLDPTWGGTSSGRAKAAIDKNHKTTYTY